MNYEFKKSVELALADFEVNYENRCQVWSFSWYKGRLISQGKNDNRTHTFNLKTANKNIQYANEKGRCAELNNFLKLRGKTNIPFNKITIINVRLDRNLQVKMSAPCSFCRNLIHFINPRNVYFSTESGFESFY